jgi:predicted short-subunit dehydrogenase-like oxidoreductase (DUF2520 family)
VKQHEKQFVILGCGNVAWHIAAHLRENHHRVRVYNHSPNANLPDFKKQLGCLTYSSFRKVESNAHYYLVCVSDSAIEETAEHLQITNPAALLVHTSGTVSVKALGTRVHPTGVIYPVQTFSRNDRINWKEIPLLLESGNGESETLRKLANLFSRKIALADHKMRMQLHLSAVFANNFTNAMVGMSQELASNAMPEGGNEMLMPLIGQTFSKLKRMGVTAAQTGPAMRKDKSVMKKHLKMLRGRPELKKIYRLMSDYIDSSHKE